MDNKISIKVDYYSLYWNNVDTKMLEAHSKVMDFFEIPMNYHNFDRMNHGEWLQEVLRRTEADVTVIIEPDCIPLNKNFLEYIKYSYLNGSFVGIAQSSNHLEPKTHIYAGTGFYCMSKNAYSLLGQPSFKESHRGDTSEEVCYKAEEIGLRYRSLMPTYFEKEPVEGIWPLSSVGYYGIGTVYANSIYHLFQARYAQNIKMFINRCEQILDNTFSTEGMYDATLFNYTGKIVP